MVTRHNLCPNPAVKVNGVGWSGATSFATLTGFPRTTGFTYSTTGNTLTTPVAAASSGLTYTGSLYIRPNGGTAVGGVLTLVIRRSVGGDDTSNSVALGTLPANTVTRISLANITPTDPTTTGVYLKVTGIDFGTRACEVTAVLLEQSATVDTYFDGDTSGATWDGTNGNSTSTLVAPDTVQAAVAAATTASLTSTAVKITDASSSLAVLAALNSAAVVTASATSAMATTAALAVTAIVSGPSRKATSTAAVTARRTSTDLVTARRTSTTSVTAKRTSSGGVT